MAIEFNDNLYAKVNRPLDFKFGPFTDVAQANSTIPISQRYHGLLFGVYSDPLDIPNSDIDYYYYFDGLTDTDYKKLNSAVVPYIGAIQDVDLGNNDIKADAFIVNSGTSSQFLKADGTLDSNSYYLASNPSLYITLTALSAGAGIAYNNTTGVITSIITQYTDALARAAISESATGLDYDNTTGVFSITSGYAIPTTVSQSNWDAAYNDKINSASVTGTSTKTLTLTQQDGGTIVASWTDIDTGLTSVGISMPSAFTVSNSPLTSNGVLSVTGAGTISQYIRGDGSLATFPSLTGYVPYTGATSNVNLGLYGLTSEYITLNPSPTTIPTAQGSIYFDDEEQTIAAVLNGSTMKIGEDLFYQIKNQTGSTITKGTALGFGGVIGSSGRVLAVPFLANGTSPSLYFLGVAYEDIINGGDGKALAFGKVRGVNTNAYPAGTILYASTTVAGGYQTTAPIAPNNIIVVAAVVTQGTANGTLLVRPTLGSNINNDEGVKIVLPVTGDLLQLQSNGLWENKSVASLNLVPQSRTLTINGTSYDLTADRSWSVGTITSLTGEATASGSGAVSVTLDNTAVTSKVLTGLNITGGTVVSTDSILQAFGKIQNEINGLIGGSIYKGTWNASTNTPTLTSSVGVLGHYYIVNVAGTTNLNGITDWEIGDWAIYDGSVWQKVDNTDAVVTVNGYIGNVSLVTGDILEGAGTLPGRPSQLYFTDARSRAALSFAAGSGAYNSSTGVITIPTNTNQLTNGANYITLASLSASSPLNYNNTTGAFTIQQASDTQSGFLSSTDYNIFANKQNALTNPVTGTGTSGQVAFWDGTSSQTGDSGLFWDNTNKSLGVGTNAPTQPFHINANAIISSNSLFYFGNVNHYIANISGFFQIFSGSNTIRIRQGSSNPVRVTLSGAGSFFSVSDGSSDDTFIVRKNGNVQIGTLTNEGFRLDVNGTVRITDQLRLQSTITNGTSTYTLPSATGTLALTSQLHDAVTIGTANGLSLSGQALSLGLASGSTNGALSSTDWIIFNNKIGGSGTTNYLAKFTAGGTVGNSAIFESGGDVGIGTDSPSALLDVFSSTGSTIIARDSSSNFETTSKLILGRSVGERSVELRSVARRAVSTNGRNRDLEIWQDNEGTLQQNVIFKFNGNLGIGTTDPSQLLEISKDGSSTATAPAIRINNTHTTIDAGNEYGRLEFYANDTSTGGVGITGYIASEAINAGVTSALVFGNRNSGDAVEMMRLNNSGNLGVGTNTPSERLHIDGRARIITIDNGTGDFATISGTGVLTRRTGAQVLSDIGALNQTAGDGRYVQKSGDTMTGVLDLNVNTVYPLTIRSGGVNQGEIGIQFNGNGTGSQTGYITANHVDASSNGYGYSFHLGSTETTTAVILDGTGDYFVGTDKLVRESRTLTGGDGILIAGVSTAQNLSANRTITVDSTVIRTTGDQTMSGTKTFSTGVSITGTGGLNMNNRNITSVNHIIIADPGSDEGIAWQGGNGWAIYESPDNLSNAGGNLQFVSGGPGIGATRRLTINTNGTVQLGAQATATNHAVRADRTITVGSSDAKNLTSDISFTLSEIGALSTSAINIDTGQVAFGTGTNQIGGDSGLSYINNISGNFGELRFGRGTNIAGEHGNISFNVNNNHNPRIYAESGGVYKAYIEFSDNSSSTRKSISFGTTDSTTLDAVERWKITQTGILQSNGAQTIQTSTGNLTLQGNGGNVGVGATTFTERLSVINSIGIESVNPFLVLRDTTVGDSSPYLIANVGSFYINFDTSSSVSNKFRIFDTGRIILGENRWEVTSGGILQSFGAQTIQTSTGNLTLATAADNGHILLSPNGTGNVGIGTASPVSALDVKSYIQIDTYAAGTTVPNLAGYLRIVSAGKTGWAPNDELGKIEFYGSDNSGIGNRNLASIRAVNSQGNGTSTTTSNGELAFYTSATNSLEAERLRIAGTGEATFSSSVTATSIIRSGGTSSQFLKADGSVDSTSYGTGSVTSVAALTIGTTGTNITSTVANGTTTPVITLNVPTASATNRGALSSDDWTTFNGKQDNIVAGTTAQYYRGDKTFQTLNTAAVPELNNLYYTEARVNANTNVAANTEARHNAVTLGTANGLSLSTQQLSLALASGSTTGALSSANWTTFNNKIGGTIATGQVAFGTGSGVIGGDSGLVWDNSTKVLGVTSNLTTANLKIIGFYGNSGSVDGSEIGICISASASDQRGAYLTSERLNSANRTNFHIYTTVGGTLPDRKWSVLWNGIFQSNGAQTIQSSTGNITIATGGDNGNILLSPNGTGNVGIGTTSPNALLEISKNGDITANAPKIRINNTHTSIDSNNEYGRIEFYANDSSTGGTGITGYIASEAINAGVTSALTFGNRNTGNAVEMMRLTNTGNLLINTTNDTGAYKLDVNGAGRFTGNLTALAFFTSSDKRKKDIISQDGDLATYRFKGDDQIRYGYIAQDMQGLYPNQVSTDNDGMLSLNYIEILVKKVHDLETKLKKHGLD